MKKEALENINSELFNSFNPEEELGIVGGATKKATGKVTHGPTGGDWQVDGEIDFGFVEEMDEVQS